MDHDQSAAVQQEVPPGELSSDASEGRSRWVRWKPWLAVAPIVIGIAVVVVMFAFRTGPPRQQTEEAARPLRVIRVERLDVTPRASGYGLAQAGQSWRAIAEVGGLLVELSDDLDSGAFVAEGDLLARIDPTDYELNLRELQANQEKIETQINELQVRQKNERALLAIQEESLDIAQREMDRIAGLVPQRAVSESQRDTTERALLTQRERVQTLRNSLDLIPVQIESLRAELAAIETKLAQARRNLERTEIRAPFDGRLGAVALERGQYVAAGATLFEMYGTAMVEVEGQFAVDDVARLLPRSMTAPFRLPIDMEQFRSLFDVSALVRYRTGDLTAQWDARFTRIRERFDARTRTLGIVVVVEEPYRKVVPGERPPLVPGTYCEIELLGRVQPGRLVIPRVALHDGAVFVVDAEGRLRRREVVVEFLQDDLVVVSNGISVGDRVVVSDPSPAVLGERIDAVVDEEVSVRLRRQAGGAGGDA